MDIPAFDSENEKLYTPSQWCNGRCEPENVVDEHIKIVRRESEKVKSEYKYTADQRYGPRPRQLFDIFEPVRASCKFSLIPTFVYIHGGYWQELNKDISCYCVAPLIKSGIRVIIAEYDLVPDVSLKVIVQEMEELVEHLGHKGANENWGSLWVGGHSAGAHLASFMLCSQVQKYITGLVLISGIYDLRPLVTTSINVAVGMSENDAENLSPMLQIQTQRSHFSARFVLIVVGEYESPAFHQQQITFIKELTKLGLYVDSKVIPQMDHFTIVEHLNDQTFFLTEIIRNLIQQKSTSSTKLS